MYQRRDLSSYSDACTSWMSVQRDDLNTGHKAGKYDYQMWAFNTGNKINCYKRKPNQHKI